MTAMKSSETSASRTRPFLKRRRHFSDGLFTLDNNIMTGQYYQCHTYCLCYNIIVISLKIVYKNNIIGIVSTTHRTCTKVTRLFDILTSADETALQGCSSVDVWKFQQFVTSCIILYSKTKEKTYVT